MSQVITNAFEQYWQSSLAAEQPVVLDEFILADIPNLDINSPIDPDTGLPPESQIVHRQNVDQRGRINNNAVAYTIVMDTTVGDFSFNAMYLRNKQNGVIGMIVYKGLETKLKTDQTTGQTGNSLVKSMLMGYDQAAEATLTNVDAGTWQIDYAARLRGMDEDIRQLQADLYGHHTFVGDGFKVVETDGAFQVTPGVAIVGGLRVELKQPEVIYPGTKPIGVWVDVHRAGSLLSEHQNHFTIITSVADLTDHVDSSGYQHFVAKLGTVQAENTVIDGRGQDGSGGIDSSLIGDPVDGTVADALEKARVNNREALRRLCAETGHVLRPEPESFGNGGTLTSAADVLLDESSGKVYGGAGPFPQPVDPLTDPGAGGFTDQSGKLLSAFLNSTQGAGAVGFSHAMLYQAASAGFRLKLSAYITDAPYGGVMGAVSDAQAAANTVAVQAAINSGVPVQIPSGVLRLIPKAGDASVLAVYPNTTIIGASRRHGVIVTSGTEVQVQVPQSGQLFELKNRVAQGTDGQGTLHIQGAAFINTGPYLGFPSTGNDIYYHPNFAAVLSANTRGLWASASAPTTDWGGYSDWRAKKDGGVDCPFLMLKDIKFQNFTFPFDVHTWMAELDGVEPYLCGPMRLYGTSVNATNCWPRKPLSHCWETRLQYSQISSSSLGEDVQGGQFGGGLHNYGGAIKLTAVGAEKTNLIHIACFKGVVYVDGLEIVAGHAAQAVGKVYADDAFIVWEAMPRCVYSDGSQSEFADNWFAATSEALLKNHILQFSTPSGAFWGNSPWLSKLTDYSGNSFVAPFATNDAGVIGAPFIRMPSVLNRLREVACAHVAIKERVILRGSSQRLTLKIYGTFDDGISPPSDPNPRQKHGLVTVKMRPMAAQDNTGAAVAPVFNYAEYSFSFSTTSAGTAKLERKHGDGFDNAAVQAFFNASVNNGGFDVKVGLLTQNATYDAYAQCVIDIEYEGSHNNNNAVPSKTLELVVS